MCPQPSPTIHPDALGSLNPPSDAQAGPPTAGQPSKTKSAPAGVFPETPHLLPKPHPPKPLLPPGTCLLSGHKVAAFPTKSSWIWAWAPRTGLAKMLGSSTLRIKRRPKQPWAQRRVLCPQRGPWNQFQEARFQRIFALGTARLDSEASSTTYSLRFSYKPSPS